MAASASGIRKRNFAEFSKGLDSKNRLADKVVFPKYETQLLYPRSGGKGGGAAARLDQLVTKLIDARSFDCCVGAHCLDAAASDVHPRDYKFCSECGKGVCPLCFDDLRDARCPHCREDDPWQVKTEKHELTKLAMEVISAKCPGCGTVCPGKALFDEHVRACYDLFVPCNLCDKNICTVSFEKHLLEEHIDPRMLVRKNMKVTCDDEIMLVEEEEEEEENYTPNSPSYSPTSPSWVPTAPAGQAAQ